MHMNSVNIWDQYIVMGARFGNAVYFQNGTRTS